MSGWSKVRFGDVSNSISIFVGSPYDLRIGRSLYFLQPIAVVLSLIETQRKGLPGLNSGFQTFVSGGFNDRRSSYDSVCPSEYSVSKIDWRVGLRLYEY